MYTDGYGLDAQRREVGIGAFVMNNYPDIKQTFYFGVYLLAVVTTIGNLRLSRYLNYENVVLPSDLRARISFWTFGT